MVGNPCCLSPGLQPISTGATQQRFSNPKRTVEFFCGQCISVHEKGAEAPMKAGVPCSSGVGGVGSIAANYDLQYVPFFRHRRFEMKLIPLSHSNRYFRSNEENSPRHSSINKSCGRHGCSCRAAAEQTGSDRLKREFYKNGPSGTATGRDPP